MQQFLKVLQPGMVTTAYALFLLFRCFDRIVLAEFHRCPLTTRRVMLFGFSTCVLGFEEDSFFYLIDFLQSILIENGK